jgi:hypothetical protein
MVFSPVGFSRSKTFQRKGAKDKGRRKGKGKSKKPLGVEIKTKGLSPLRLVVPLCAFALRPWALSSLR